MSEGKATRFEVTLPHEEHFGDKNLTASVIIP